MSKNSKKLSSNAQRKVDALVAQMQRAFQQQNWELCEQLCLQIESWEPNNPESANVRGIVAVQMGDARAAEHYFVIAVNEDSQRESFQLNLANLYLGQGLPQDALARFQAAQQINPKNLVAILGAGQCLLQLNEKQQAYDVFKQGKYTYPESDDVDMGLFRAAFQLNKLDESEQYVQAVLARSPEHAEAHLAMGQISLQRGDFDKAEKETLQALNIEPNLALAYNLLVQIKTFSHDDQSIIDAMIKLRQLLPKESISYVNLTFSLGKVMEDLAEYDRAFEYIKMANDMRHQHLTYDNESEIAHLQAVVDLTSEKQFECVSELEENAPIFIVGMPRCGSTLVEQVLASHPDVESMGECGFFEAAIAEYHDSEDPLTLEKMQSFTKEEWGSVGQAYMRMVRESHPDARHVTDKSLTNIRFVGAIHQALPHAKIIHVQRHALDTCWSIYKNHLLSPTFSYGFNLGQLGYYYRAYERLMAHWVKALPEGAMYEIDYEELVQHQEIETLQLLSTCDLDSSDACFHFEKAPNITLTASQTQVRKPMYATSVGKSEHYKKHLQSLIQTLGQ